MSWVLGDPSGAGMIAVKFAGILSAPKHIGTSYYYRLNEGGENVPVTSDVPLPTHDHIQGDAKLIWVNVNGPKPYRYLALEVIMWEPTR